MFYSFVFDTLNTTYRCGNCCSGDWCGSGANWFLFLQITSVESLIVRPSLRYIINWGNIFVGLTNFLRDEKQRIECLISIIFVKDEFFMCCFRKAGWILMHPCMCNFDTWLWRFVFFASKFYRRKVHRNSVIIHTWHVHNNVKQEY